MKDYISIFKPKNAKKVIKNETCYRRHKSR